MVNQASNWNIYVMTHIKHQKGEMVCSLRYIYPPWAGVNPELKMEKFQAGGKKNIEEEQCRRQRDRKSPAKMFKPQARGAPALPHHTRTTGGHDPYQASRKIYETQIQLANSKYSNAYCVH